MTLAFTSSVSGFLVCNTFRVMLHTGLDCGRACKSKDRVLQTFATCAYALQRCIEIQDGGGLVLSLEEAEECYSSLILHLRTYSWLASFHWEERRLLFRMRPKHHILYHQALQLKEWRINQSVFHCFDQESFLGKIKNICQKCHGRSATRQIYNRYLLCVAMMLEQHRRIVS